MRSWIRQSLLFAGFAAALASGVHAQADSTERSWNLPVEPFRIVDNIYYVGAAELGSYLITTPAGHFLLDGGFAETAPQILKNITKLGFKPTDVRVLLNSHGHYDHAAGLAELKRVTGARLVVSAAERILLESGGAKDAHFPHLTFPPVMVDSTFEDGAQLVLGGVTLTANITAGHTQGCTTWTMTVREAGREYGVVIDCSISAPGYKLVNNAAYPDIIADYEKTFARMRTFRCEVFLSAHGWFFDFANKRAAFKAEGSNNPFIDPAGCRTHIDNQEARFRKAVLDQRAAR